MLTIIVTRILIFFLVIYIVNMVYHKYLKGSVSQRKMQGPAQREYTEYDQDEWEKIKKSLGE